MHSNIINTLEQFNNSSEGNQEQRKQDQDEQGEMQEQNGEVSHLSKEKQLDVLLLYLRRVHFYCFYSGEENEDERMLACKCAPVYLRNAKTVSESEYEEAVQNSYEIKNFEEKYLEYAKQRLEKGPQVLENPENDTTLVEMKEKYAEKKIHE